MPCRFKKYEDLKWIGTWKWHNEIHAAKFRKVLKEKYPNVSMTVEQLETEINGKMIYRISVEFQNNADEAEFIMRESV